MKKSWSRYARNNIEWPRRKSGKHIHYVIILCCLLFAKPSDSQAAVACMQPTCPNLAGAINALPFPSGSRGSMPGVGGASVGVTLVWYSDAGMVQGTHWCATNIGYGSHANPVKNQSPSGSSGSHCYCKLSYIGNTACAGGSWIYVGDPGSASLCSSVCADHCSIYIQENPLFRAAFISSDTAPSYEVFDTSSCPDGYVAVPSNVGTLTKNDVASGAGVHDISCNWQ
jgi:hypothetical protein